MSSIQCSVVMYDNQQRCLLQPVFCSLLKNYTSIKQDPAFEKVLCFVALGQVSQPVYAVNLFDESGHVSWHEFFPALAFDHFFPDLS